MQWFKVGMCNSLHRSNPSSTLSRVTYFFSIEAHTRTRIASLASRWGLVSGERRLPLRLPLPLPLLFTVAFAVAFPFAPASAFAFAFAFAFDSASAFAFASAFASLHLPLPLPLPLSSLPCLCHMTTISK